jgi:hypothetical protein
MPFNSLPSLPVVHSSLRKSLVTLLGPAPNLNAILILARTGSMPDIEEHKFRLIGYRDNLMALLNLLEENLLEDSFNSPGTKPITSARQAIAVPNAA